MGADGRRELFLGTTPLKILTPRGDTRLWDADRLPGGVIREGQVHIAFVCICCALHSAVLTPLPLGQVFHTFSLMAEKVY